MKILKVTADFEFQVEDNIDKDDVQLVVEPHAARLVVGANQVADCHETVEMGEVEDLGDAYR